MEKLIRVAVMAGLGLYEKSKEAIEELVKKGKISRDEGAVLVKDLMEKDAKKLKDLKDKIETAARKAIEHLPPVAIKKELERIEAKIDELSSRLAKLEKPRSRQKRAHLRS